MFDEIFLEKKVFKQQLLFEYIYIIKKLSDKHYLLLTLFLCSHIEKKQGASLHEIYH